MPSKAFSRRTLLAAAVIQALATASVQSAEITVNSLLDDDDGDNCTLREAVISANADSEGVGGCAAGAGDDVIVFAPSLTGTLTLSTGPLVVTNTLSIQGPGASLLDLDAERASRHFLSFYGGTSSHSLTLSDMTLSNGSAAGNGGSIVTNEPLTLNNVLLRNNTANTGGAISAEFSNITLNAAQLSNNTAVQAGGGMSVSSSQVTINRSNFDGNRAANGGCIDISDGSLTVADSSLISCRVTGNGGAVRNDSATVNIATSQVSYHEAAGYGGAIWTQGGSVTLTEVDIRSNVAGNGAGYGSGGAVAHLRGGLTVNRSELSGNVADGAGGILTSGGSASATLINSTLSGNTGGVAGGMRVSGAFATLTHVTVANNSANFGAGLYQEGGVVTLNNSLLVENQGEDCGFFNDGYTVNLRGYQSTIDSDGTCGVTQTGNVGLEPLANRGGRTRSHLIAQNGLADGTADMSLCDAVDQRGRPRIASSCDVGAVQFSGLDSPVIEVNTLQDLSADDGQCSLREALAAAASDGPSGAAMGECVAGFQDDAIAFAGAMLPGTISAAGGAFLVDSAVQIRGPGVDRLTLDGEGASRIFQVDAPGPTPVAVRMTDLTLTRGNAIGAVPPLGGGAIYNSEMLTLDDVLIQGNTSSGAGGAIRSVGPLDIEDTTFFGNESTGDRGGAVSTEGATARIEAVTFSANTAALSGGALHHSGASLNLAFGTLVNNSAPAGGGLDLQGPSNLDATVVFNNSGEDCQAGTPPGGLLINWVGDGSCSVGALTGNPNLDLALADNGGDTPTHNLLPGSGLVDQLAEENCVDFSEQRSSARNIDGNADGVRNCDIGAVEYTDVTGPSAMLTSAPDVPARGDSYSLTVTYADADGVVDATTFDLNDVTVTPGALTASQVSNIGNAVTYVFSAPGGLNNANAGMYTVTLQPDQVFDGATTGVNPASSAVLGTFELLAAAQISDATFTINRESAVGTIVDQVVLNDPTGEVPASGGWEITAGNASAQYSIDDSGVIRTAASPVDTAVLTVAINNGASSLDTAQITINALTEVIFRNGFED
ncbi:MAG: beta strand repeat-containing protein [Lysobacterales bacterium]